MKTAWPPALPLDPGDAEGGHSCKKIFTSYQNQAGMYRWVQTLEPQEGLFNLQFCLSGLPSLWLSELGLVFTVEILLSTL